MGKIYIFTHYKSEVQEVNDGNLVNKDFFFMTADMKTENISVCYSK